MSTPAVDPSGIADDFDVERYQAEHKPPSETESAFISIVMFLGLLVFAAGCWALRHMM